MQGIDVIYLRFIFAFTVAEYASLYDFLII
jgi:hypothetical protein